MPNSYQQPSFKFSTNIASYQCNYEDFIEGEEKWVVEVEYKGSQNLTGRFQAPKNWSREQLFGWLSRMELSEVE